MFVRFRLLPGIRSAEIASDNLMSYSARAQVECSRIRKNSEVCIIHGRILTNPATTKHLNQTRAEYMPQAEHIGFLNRKPQATVF